MLQQVLLELLTGSQVLAICDLRVAQASMGVGSMVDCGIKQAYAMVKSLLVRPREYVLDYTFLNASM